MRMYRSAKTDVFCPNCGEVLFTFNPDALFKRFDAPFQKFQHMCEKHSCCPYCGFAFEKIDSDLFFYVEVMCGMFGTAEGRRQFLNTHPEVEKLLHDYKSRYKIDHFPKPKNW